MGSFNEAKVRYAVVEPASGFEDGPLDDMLRRAIEPGAGTRRYRRIWRMGQVWEEDGILLGRIGFQTNATTEIFDEDIRDFREGETREGTTATFALRLTDGVIAHQRRGNDIRPTSFTGAFQGLLNDVAPYARWRVSEFRREVNWSQWSTSVDKITELRFHLERPNPNYRDRERIESLIEGTESEEIELVLASLGGLDANSELVQQALAHADRYGKVAAKAERLGQDQEVTWTSAGEEVVERSVETTLDGEAEPNALARSLDDVTRSGADLQLEE